MSEILKKKSCFLQFQKKAWKEKIELMEQFSNKFKTQFQNQA